MSLDDQLNPNDGSLIDKVDNYFYEFNRAIAIKWQDKTYKPAKTLRRGLYGIGAIGFLANAVQTSTYIFGVTATWLGIKSAHPDMGSLKNGLESEIQSEAIGLTPKFLKGVNALFYSIGVVETVSGLGYLVHGIANKDNDSLMASAKLLSLGIGWLSWWSAEYMARGDYGDPPKKEPDLNKKKKYGGLLLDPTLVPVQPDL